MSILVDGSSRVLVQGMTGREGSFHTERMLAAGTSVVAGVTPGKGGQTACGLPVFDTVSEAVAATGADVSVIFVPARFAKAAVLQAAEGGVRDRRAHHRGHPGPRHERGRLGTRAGRRPRGRTALRPHRPQLPRHRHAGRLQRRYHGGLPVQARQGRHGLAQRDPDLRDRDGPHPRRPGPVDLRRHGRGPRPRARLPGVSGAVRGGPSDRGHRPRRARSAATTRSAPPHSPPTTSASRSSPTSPASPLRPASAWVTPGAIISGSSGTAAAKAAALEAAGVPVARRPDETPALVAEALAAI